MIWHLIEGEAGCRYAVERNAVAVIVDALRASATAAALLQAGAQHIMCFDTTEDALTAKQSDPDALLFGERDGVPPPGFDFGNSPLDAPHADGRNVLFTTTTGTQRIHQARGAASICLASCVNALAAVSYLQKSNTEIVLIPAGKAGDPDFDAAEDWAAAACLAQFADAEVGEGAVWYREWRQRLEWDGLEAHFRGSPHGQRLIELGFEDDVAFCSQANTIDLVPVVNNWRSEVPILGAS